MRKTDTCLALKDVEPKWNNGTTVHADEWETTAGFGLSKHWFHWFLHLNASHGAVMQLYNQTKRLMLYPATDRRVQNNFAFSPDPAQTQTPSTAGQLGHVCHSEHTWPKSVYLSPHVAELLMSRRAELC